MNVEKLRIGVDVRREARVGMPHRGLSRPQGHAPFAQEGAEGCAKCMHVERPAALVALGDAGRSQVAVEDVDQTGRNVEDEGIGGQPRRDRLAPAQGFRLERGELVGEPVLQVFRQVGPDDDAVPFPVLLVVGVEFHDTGSAPSSRS